MSKYRGVHRAVKRSEMFDGYVIRVGIGNVVVYSMFLSQIDETIVETETVKLVAELKRMLENSLDVLTEFEKQGIIHEIN
jgi:hypothetical protein